MREFPYASVLTRMQIVVKNIMRVIGDGVELLIVVYRNIHHFDECVTVA